MNKLAFLYPGQGVQTPGMGADFYRNSALARAVFDEASAVLGMDMTSLCFENNDRLDQTEYTQAALVTLYLAQTRVLTAAGIRPDITAGLSLGEYAALAVSHAIREVDAIHLVRRRGILMQNAVPDGSGAMCAVLGMKEAAVEEVLADREGVFIANYNCPGQLVITGTRPAVEEAAEALRGAGARRTVMLNVSGPFHSPLLVNAARELERELFQTPISDPDIPYITNVTAEVVTTKEPVRTFLAQQICAPVRWMQSMQRMIADGVDTFVEIGAGKTLAGFLRKLDRNVTVYPVTTWEEAQDVMAKLGAENEKLWRSA